MLPSAATPQPLPPPARIYVEPTSLCNLDCRTCMRNAWSEAGGRMAANTFARVLAGAASFSPIPEIFFGGYGEPLSHPQIMPMLRAAHAAGARTQLITNATLLDGGRAAALIEAGLDGLWVSLDGARPASYADVRLGAELDAVVANLERLAELRARAGAGPELGLACVAMRRNLADLPDLLALGARLGARRFLLTHVLPHTAELVGEALYLDALYGDPAGAREQQAGLERLAAGVLDLAGHLGYTQVEVAGARGRRACPFLEKDSLAVRWDGAVSPCLPLLHAHTAYLGERRRDSHACAFGRLDARGLREIWEDDAYIGLRARLADFDFSPCVACNACEMADANQEDCFGNLLPACGGCLWAGGWVKCP